MADGAPCPTPPTTPTAAPTAARQQLVQAGPCPRGGGPCAPGLAFLRQLARTQDAVAQSGVVAADFEISGQAQLRCGATICPVRWRAGQGGCRVEAGAGAAAPAVVLETRPLALN